MLPAYENREPLGPGVFVAVVGPSGSGKDTLLALARAAFASSPPVTFVRRVVTRPSDGTEDHATLTQQAFAAENASGAFALTWHAHGHDYGLPAALDDDIAAGRVVVANVSRDVIALARRRYCAVRVVLVTAPADVLEARRAARQRASDAATSRAERAAQRVELGPEDLEIVNDGSREAAAAQFVEFLNLLLSPR